MKLSLKINLCLLGLLALAAPALGEEFALGHNITRDAVPAAKGESSGTLKRFSDSYKSQHSPKLAIFLNRTLSDDVREWTTSERSVIAGSGSVTSSSETPLRYREETVKGPVAVYRQQENGVQEARDNTSESYLWELEAGFMQPFLNAGAKLVDRATILRLVSKNSDQGIAHEVIETKKNEMNALLNHADIYIEILVTRTHSAPGAYEFKAVAKEVKTGRVLGIASSLDRDMEKERSRKIVTTSEGYKIVDAPKKAKVKNVSSDVALELMNSMVTGWSVN